MSGKTKIVVLHMKEVVYTVLFLILAIILGALLFFMFGPGKNEEAASHSVSFYKPGVYTSSISLNDNNFDVEVTVDTDRIKAIRMVNLSESTTAMFPLMEPTLDSLASQICAAQSLENIDYSDESKYTSLLLLNAISEALEKAKVEG